MCGPSTSWWVACRLRDAYGACLPADAHSLFDGMMARYVALVLKFCQISSQCSYSVLHRPTETIRTDGTEVGCRCQHGSSQTVGCSCNNSSAVTDVMGLSSCLSRRGQLWQLPRRSAALAASAASPLLVARGFPLGRPDDIQKSALYTSTHVRPGDAQKQSISPFQAFADAKQQQDLRTLHVKGGRVLL
jgi:hypothetical protein